MAPTLSTPRLRLRPWRDDDLKAFAELNSDPKVMQHLPAALSRDESDAMAARLRARLENDGYGGWAVERVGEAPFIGFIGLARPSFSAHFTPCVEIGWRLSSAHWGLGLATEGARAVLHFGFAELGLDEIVSFTSTENHASKRVMEKLGMRRDDGGEFDHPSLPEGHRLRRHLLYRLARADGLELDTARAR